MAPTKPSSNSNAKVAASAGATDARAYRRHHGAQAQGAVTKRDGDSFDDASETTHESSLHAPSVVDTRQNDFSERSWWMVDVDGEGASTQGASALVKRCMRAYGWDLSKTRKILSAYKHFLTLKKVLGDWDATLLSPCHLVDQMWHQHILDNFNYYHDMVLLCGHFVGHNPDGAFDVEAKATRDQFTRECLRQNFGSYDVEIWDGAGRNGMTNGGGRDLGGGADGDDEVEIQPDAVQSANRSRQRVRTYGRNQAQVRSGQNQPGKS